MRKSKVAKYLAGLVALSLMASACGDDSDQDTTPTPTTAAPSGGDNPTTTAGGTGGGETGCDASMAPIKIGGLTQAVNFSGMEDGIKAIVDKANIDCIGGHKLEFVGLKDDGSDPAKNLEAARSLVEQDGVFAIIATSAVLLPQTTDYLAEQKVPFFGWGFMPGFCGDDQWGYGFNGCLSAFAFDYSDKTNGSLSQPVAEIVGKPADEMTMAIFSSDDDAGTFGEKQYAALFSKSQVLVQDRVPVQGAGDYTGYVNAIKAASPDAVMISTDFVSGIKMKAALSQAGYTGLVYDYVTYIPGLLDADASSAAALEGGYSVSQFPANEDDTPAIKQITEDLKASGSPLPFATQGASIGYWSTELLRQMLVATAAKGEITPDNFRTTVDTDGFTSEALEGGLGAISFPEAHTQLVPCAGVVQVVDGAYESAVPFACYDLLDAVTD